jgi:hypothetical protein
MAKREPSSGRAGYDAKQTEPGSRHSSSRMNYRLKIGKSRICNQRERYQEKSLKEELSANNEQIAFP